MAKRPPLWRMLSLIFLGAHAGAAQETREASSSVAATLTGFVRDSAGKPIADAQVLLRDTQFGTRTDSEGRFSLSSMAQGKYVVWFRRLGYASTEYHWTARTDERTQLSVVLTQIPRALDPMVVRAQEDKRAAARAGLRGTVVDDNGTPLDDAEVQIVGANMVGMTRANGDFLFRPVGTGSYVVRARKIGYAPTARAVQLVEDDDREVVIVLARLPNDLDPVRVTVASGYSGGADVPWIELEQRRRWTMAKVRVLGPEDLKAYQGQGLDFVSSFQGIGEKAASMTASRPTGIPVPGRTNGIWHDFDVAEEACVLINGRDAKRMSLSSLSTRDIQLLEVYPGGTFPSDLTNTVASHFRDPQCRAKVPPDSAPTYWVVWLKP